MKKIKLVVFDMAGTTVDEKNVVYKTVHKALTSHGVEVDLNTVLRIGAGKEKHQAIKDVMAALGVENLSSEDVFSDFKTLLDEAYESLDVSPIKGVDETMAELRKMGVIVVLNTGYNSRVANGLIEKLNWKKGIDYDALITADDVEKGRPHPEMIEKAMEMFGILEPSEVLKAGDSVIDIVEGQNAGCGITIGVLSGAQSREQLETENPTYILESLAVLAEELGDRF